MSLFKSVCGAQNMLEEIPSDEDSDSDDGGSKKKGKKGRKKAPPKPKTALKFTNSNQQFKGNSRIFYTAKNEKETKDLMVGVLKDNSLFWVCVKGALGNKIWYSDVGDEVYQKIKELHIEFRVENDVLMDINTTIKNITKRREYKKMF